MTNRPSSNSAVSIWLAVLAVVALSACAIVVISDLVGWLVVDRHNPVSETISKLAIGRYAWIQDIGLDIFAGGLVACAIGLFLWNAGNWRWHLAGILLLLVAADVVVIAEYNQYQGLDGFGGRIHLACCYVLYLLVAGVAVLLAFELRAIGRKFFWISLGFAAYWLVGGPLFMFVVPTSVDGAVERLMALGFVVWICMLAWLIWQRGRGRLNAK